MEGMLVHRIAEMSDDNPGEKHASGAQANAAEFQTAQRHSEYTNKGERADRVRDRLRFVELEEPVHRLLETIVPVLPTPVHRHWFYSAMQRAARAFQRHIGQHSGRPEDGKYCFGVSLQQRRLRF